MPQKIKNFAFKSWPYAIFIAISLIMLPTSFIYQVSPIGDINTMLAMGNSLAHGTIPFVDIFEQRGPYMYVLHLVAALPGNSLHWIYIVELINFYFIYRILIKVVELSKYANVKNSRFYASIILSLYLFSPTVWYGAAPEEFCLLPITYIIYVVLKQIKNTDTFYLTKKQVFTIGLSFGWIIFLKYSNIGAPVGLFFSYGLYLLYKKQIKSFFQTVGLAITGVIIASLPVVLGYALTGHLKSAAHAYFVENTGASAYTLQSATLKILNLLLTNTVSNIAILMLLLFPFVLAIIKLKHETKVGLYIITTTLIIQTLMSTLILRYLPTYFSGTIIIILTLFAWMSPELKLTIQNSSKTVKTFLSVVIILPAIFFAFILNGRMWHFDTLFIHNYVTNINSDASYKQGKLVKNNGGGTIEVYGDVARSIYQWADSYPTLKYFDQTTIPYKSQPQAGNSQYNYIATKKAKWVQTPVLGISTKEISYSNINSFIKYQQNHNHVKNSETSIAAQIDAPKMRALKYPKQYTNPIYGYDGKNYFIMGTVPKVLTENYVLVNSSQNYGLKTDFTWKNKKISTFSNYLLFTTKENAKTHHLKTISFEIAK